MKVRVPSLSDFEHMTEEEIKKALLFSSYFSTQKGPLCQCLIHKLNFFHAMLPQQFCATDLTDVTLDTPLEGTASSLCACQAPHFYKFVLGRDGMSFEEIDGEVMDKRKLNLPNERDY